MSPDYYCRREVIEILGCNDEFIDELEREELVRHTLIEPQDEWVFSPQEVERIRIIRNLVEDLEVNIAGVEVIMAMRDNIIQMQRQFDQILSLLVMEIKNRINDGGRIR